MILIETQTLKIASGGTDSSGSQGGLFAAYGLVMPATFTGSSISFKVSADGTTYQALYELDDAATGTQRQVTLAVTQGRSYSLPDALTSWRSFQVISNGAEGGARDLVLVCKAP